MSCEDQEMKDFKFYLSGETLEFSFDLKACCKTSAILQVEDAWPDFHIVNVVQVDKLVH
jgi:hypothetical protein